MRLIDADALMAKIHKIDAMLNVRTIAIIAEEIENAPTVNEWIPCTEKLPKDDGMVLAYSKENDGVIINWIQKGNEWAWLDGDIVAWMPLPEPYKGGVE